MRNGEHGDDLCLSSNSAVESCKIKYVYLYFAVFSSCTKLHCSC